MRLVVLALASLALTGAQQRGTVAAVTADTAPAGTATVFTVTGNNPCSTIRVDFGDGTNETHTIQSMPANIRHTYARAGTYQVRARGIGNCVGLAAMTVRVAAGRSADPRTPAENMRFRAMDRNGDGQISRAEWRGSAQSFRVHDWNNDGVLSGDEVRPGANRQVTDDPDYAASRYWPEAGRYPARRSGLRPCRPIPDDSSPHGRPPSSVAAAPR